MYPFCSCLHNNQSIFFRRRPPLGNFSERRGDSVNEHFKNDDTQSLPLGHLTNMGQNMKDETTLMPLLDQHILLVKEHSTWWLPAAGGILAVALRFCDPILEYIDLNSGLFKNIFESISGGLKIEKFLIHRFYNHDVLKYYIILSTIYLQSPSML